MASVTINGTVKLVGKTQQVSERFSKREIVIQEAGGSQYPQFLPVEFAQEKTNLLDAFAPGDEVSVTCYVNGREWTGRDGVTKYFLSLRGDRIEKAGAAAGAPAGYRQAPEAASVPPSGLSEIPPAGEDDLPF